MHPGGPIGLSPTATVVLEGIDTPYHGQQMTVGDVNGDGYDDLLAGEDLAVDFSGRAFLYAGGPSGLSAVPLNTFAGEVMDELGTALAIVGDIDADGYDDAVITTGMYGPGDLSGNGYDDVLLPRPFEGIDPYEGRADVHLGGPDGLDTTPVTSLYGTPLGGGELSVVHLLGDIDEDGLPDVAFRIQQGDIYHLAVKYGDPVLGLDPSVPHDTIPEPVQLEGFGVAGATADVDGDGHLDFLVGACGSSVSGLIAGAA